MALGAKSFFSRLLSNSYKVYYWLNEFMSMKGLNAFCTVSFNKPLFHIWLQQNHFLDIQVSEKKKKITFQCSSKNRSRCRLPIKRRNIMLLRSKSSISQKNNKNSR